MQIEAGPIMRNVKITRGNELPDESFWSSDDTGSSSTPPNNRGAT